MYWDVPYGELEISIHAPRGGSDARAGRPHRDTGDFNPRSPWGERQRSVPKITGTAGFQSTLPVGGATGVEKITRLRRPRFQSTLPVGGATLSGTEAGRQLYISIHAPRGGSDYADWRCCSFVGHFNPRSPWGERR